MRDTDAAADGFERLFATDILRRELPARVARTINADIEAAVRDLAARDTAGAEWCRTHGYVGYTSYVSLDDLPSRYPVFADLVAHLDRAASAFAAHQHWALGRGRLRLDALWVNLLRPGGFHTGHIHPNSIISGTYYVRVPDGAPALRFEDPRLAMMMGAPPRSPDTPAALRAHRTLDPPPGPGTLVVWESWLRHEVALNRAATDRISVSFNYAWT
jgi:uncharacterized protein (TIGR02466 family)